MARPGEAKTSPRRLRARLRQAEALRLRLAGAEYGQIAGQLGYRGRDGAYRAVEAALREAARDGAGDELVLNLRRLNRLLFTWWPRAIGLEPEGKPMPPDLAASAEVRAILAERAKLLGLYPAPGSLRQEHIDDDLLRQEAERAARDLGLSVQEVLAEALGIIAEQRR